MRSKNINRDLLISEVKTRNPLWEDTHPLFRNKKEIEKLWKEVADACKCNVSDCKNKWKNLKDQFRKEIKKLPFPRSADLHEDSTPSMKPKWQYFEQLFFLKDYVVPESFPAVSSKTQGNSPISKQTTIKREEEQCSEFDITEQVEKSAMSPQPSHSSEPSRDELGSHRRKRNRTDLHEEFFECNNLEILQRNEDDADLLFFKSLLPHMVDFTDLEKLQIKADILSVILEKKRSKR